MTALRSLFRPALAAGLAATLALPLALAPSAARGQDGQVIVVVNGLPITSFDIPQRQRLLQIREGRPHSREQALQDLIDDRIKYSEALRFRAAATEAQVNAAYAQVAQRSGIDPRGFDQVLRAQGIEPRVYKGKLRADLSWSNIVGARYGRTIFVTDTQLADAIARRQGGTNRPVEYLLRPVVLLVPPTAPAARVQQRMAEAAALRNRFTNCATDLDRVRQIPDAAVREQFRRQAADLSPAFRQVLEQTAVGKLTPPSRSQQGIEMIAVCGRSEISANDTTVRNQVREEIQTEEMRRISADYLARLRRIAVIEHRTGRGGQTGRR